MSEKHEEHANNFDEGETYEVGFAMGQMDLVGKLKKAYQMGEVEELIDHFTPKSFEDCEKYEKEKGISYDDRWN